MKNNFLRAVISSFLVLTLASCAQIEPQEISANLKDQTIQQQQVLGKIVGDSDWQIEDSKVVDCNGVEGQSRFEVSAWGNVVSGVPSDVATQISESFRSAGFIASNPVIDYKTLDSKETLIKVKATNVEGSDFQITIDELLTIHSVGLSPCMDSKLMETEV